MASIVVRGYIPQRASGAVSPAVMPLSMISSITLADSARKMAVETSAYGRSRKLDHLDVRHLGQHGQSLPKAVLHARLGAVGHPLGNPQPEAAALGAVGAILVRPGRGRLVAFVMAGHRVEHEAAVVRGEAHRSGLVHPVGEAACPRAGSPGRR